MKLVMDTRPFPFRITGARIAMLGYGPDAAPQALGLRDAGNEVSIATRSGGLSWARARRDRFATGPVGSTVERASVVVLLVPDEEQAPVYWDEIASDLAPGALLVLGRALALGTGAFDPCLSRGAEPRRAGAPDVVFVAATGRLVRVAVHHDATGRALERAISYARAAFGLDVAIATTTIAAEVDAELGALEARAGGAAALRTGVALALDRVRCSHAPEEARLAFHDGLLALVDARARRAQAAGGRDRESQRALADAYHGTRGQS